MILVTVFGATLAALVRATLALIGVVLATSVFLLLVVAFIGAAVVGLLGS
jgi:hypothetical protein